jgi:Ca-activated chloride channel family protein
MIEEKAKGGVFLSVLGFGMGNYKDGRMEELSNRGNGNYAYVDSLREARKVLVEEMTSTLVTIAKDVKIQIFFNPQRVAGYRLVGYENRMLKKQDFNDDTKDAGEIGAGHAVTALYELVPSGEKVPAPRSDKNPFMTSNGAASSNAFFRLRLRYKPPEGDTSTLMEQDITEAGDSFDGASTDFRFAAAVAGFGMLLRESPHKGTANFDMVLEIAQSAYGADPHGYRREFADMVLIAKGLTGVK